MHGRCALVENARLVPRQCWSVFWHRCMPGVFARQHNAAVVPHRALHALGKEPLNPNPVWAGGGRDLVVPGGWWHAVLSLAPKP